MHTERRSRRGDDRRDADEGRIGEREYAGELGLSRRRADVGVLGFEPDGELYANMRRRVGVDGRVAECDEAGLVGEDGRRECGGDGGVISE